MSTKKPSRRRFLKSSALAASAVALSQSLVARSAHAAGSDTVKIGMIGCGGRCSGAARDAMDADAGLKLVAMCDLFADRIKNSRNSLKGQKPQQVDVADDRMFVGLDGYKKVIAEADAVLIACAAKFHPLYVKTAIEAGKHAFCEKPHGIDPAGMRQLGEAVELAKQKKLSILSGLQSRFDSAIQETIKRIHDGQIGDIVAIEENFVRPPYGGLTRPAGLPEIQAQYSNQYRFSWLCGDDVPQSLVHNMDRATWALKEAAPVRCHGLAGRSGVQFQVSWAGDVFDHHTVVYHYANGGGSTRWRAPTPTATTKTPASSWAPRASPTSSPAASPARTNGDSPASATTPMSRSIAQFFKAIRDGNPINCGDYMVRSTTVCIMGQMSCYSGKEVTWDQITKSNYNLGPKPEECTWDMEPPVKPDEKGIYPVYIPGVTKNV